MNESKMTNGGQNQACIVILNSLLLSILNPEEQKPVAGESWHLEGEDRLMVYVMYQDLTIMRGESIPSVVKNGSLYAMAELTNVQMLTFDRVPYSCPALFMVFDGCILAISYTSASIAQPKTVKSTALMLLA